MKYIYRYQTYHDGKAITCFHYTNNDKFMEAIRTEGSCTAFAPGLRSGSTRVKPMNVMELPEKYRIHFVNYKTPSGLPDWSAYRQAYDQLLNSLALIPWTVDLRTVNLDDYPELFI